MKKITIVVVTYRLGCGEQFPVCDAATAAVADGGLAVWRGPRTKSEGKWLETKLIANHSTLSLPLPVQAAWEQLTLLYELLLPSQEYVRGR